MPSRIHKPEYRATLDPQDRPYFQRIGPGLHVGYRKGKTKASWVIRWKEKRGYRSLTVKGIAPDDIDTVRGARNKPFQEIVEIAMNEGVYYCSFCKKSSKEVEKLVAGPNVFICNECIHLCQLYMDNPSQRGSLKFDDNGDVVFDNDGQPVFVELPETGA